MKSRPILFKDEMIRAILEGRKTQTRRVVKPQPRGDQIMPREWSKVMRQNKNSIYGDGLGWCAIDESGNDHEFRCPYGQPGDRLFVREAFRLCAEADGIKPRDTDAAYRVWYEADAPHQPGFGKLRPSMFMPRWASRITLEITGVRVERLQGISYADAQAEGVQTETADPWFYHIPTERNVYDFAADEPQGSFRKLWESINGLGSWGANPWVWCIEFKRVQS